MAGGLWVDDIEDAHRALLNAAIDTMVAAQASREDEAILQALKRAGIPLPEHGWSNETIKAHLLLHAAGRDIAVDLSDGKVMVLRIR